MKFNERQLVLMSFNEADFEGRLHFKKIWIGYPDNKGYKERWFKVKSNILFYFKLNWMRQPTSKEPSGLFILENSDIHFEEKSETPFAFSITFQDEPERKYLFSARSDSEVNQWISVLKCASFGFWKTELLYLKEKLKEQLKKRNEEVRSDSFSTANGYLERTNLMSSAIETSNYSKCANDNLIQF